MKWLVIIFILAILIRIETVLRWFEESKNVVTPESTEVEVLEKEKPDITIIPLEKDQLANASPIAKLLILLEEFYRAPSEKTKIQIYSHLFENKFLLEKMDQKLKGEFAKWEGLIQQNDPWVNSLLLELSRLGGLESQVFFLKILAHNFETRIQTFIPFYFKEGKDTKCILATYLPEMLNKDLWLDFYISREEDLLSYIQVTDDEKLKAYATACLEMVQLKMGQLQEKPENPVVPPPTTPPANDTSNQP